jgi:hydrogenase 3 maturation protease
VNGGSRNLENQVKVTSEWADRLESVITSNYVRREIHFLGLGNPIKSDDSVGSHIISRMKSVYGTRPSENVIIHSFNYRANDFLFSKILGRSHCMIIFDSAEFDSKPGSIIFEELAKTRYGVFSTHNIPLSLLAKSELAYVLGIQPKDVGIGEKLSDTVQSSANEVCEKVCFILDNIMKSEIDNSGKMRIN